jgi:hypothetical protein
MHHDPKTSLLFWFHDLPFHHSLATFIENRAFPNSSALLCPMPCRASSPKVQYMCVRPPKSKTRAHALIAGDRSLLLPERWSNGSSRSMLSPVPLASQCLYDWSGFLGPVMTSSTSPISSSICRFFSASSALRCRRLRRTTMNRMTARMKKRLQVTQIHQLQVLSSRSNVGAGAGEGQ